MRQFTPKQVMVPLVICLTAAHAALRWTSAGKKAQDVSPLQGGEVVSAPMPALVDDLHCLRLIVFSPDCPFCQHAADRENETLSQESRSERLWYTDSETATLPIFV